MKYDNETLEQINDQADLVSYAQDVFDLTPRGNDYFTHCPFHEDKTPSLSFSRSANSFYCFSCGISGRMIGFLMKFEKLSFEEAVQKASRLANIDLNSLCHSETISFLRNYRRTLQSCNQQTKYEHPILPKSDYTKFKQTEIKQWLDEGIEQEVMDLFEIRFDDYGNRIVYPVYDINGNLINIKGRTLYDNYKQLGLTKYMNYYKVGVMDYFQGLNITLPYVRQEREIIVFESIKSVMKAYGWGYRNSVSAEKHTLTPEQIKLLLSLKVDIVLAYDSDVDYFHGATYENIEVLRRLTNVYIITDKYKLLGGSKAKNSPVDCGLDVWEELYYDKRKVV